MMFLPHLAVAVAAFSSTSGWGSENLTKKEFSSSKISNVIISNAAGNVDISGTKKTGISIIAEEVNFRETCKVSYEEQGVTLTIRFEQQAPSFFARLFSSEACLVNFTLTVPRDTNLRINTGAGDVDVADIDGNLALNTGSGDVYLNDLSGLMRVKTGSGDIEAANISNLASLETGSGNLNVVYEKTPNEGELSVSTGRGATEIALPQHAKVAPSLHSGSGEVKTDAAIEASVEAKFKISVKSGAGDINLRKL